MTTPINTNVISNAHRKVIHYLLDIFDVNKIEYQFTGGFAGNLFGSLWKLQDIDIETDLKTLYKIQELLMQFVVLETHRYEDEEFQIWLLQLEIENVIIDINAVEDFIIKPDFKIETDIQNFIMKCFDRRIVKVQPLKDIIEYKKKLNRIEDLKELLSL